MSEIKIPLADLKVGHYVKLPGGWGNHPFLFSSFRIKGEEQLQIIRNLGMSEITVDPERSRVPVAIPPVESPPPPPSPHPSRQPDPDRQHQQSLRRSMRVAERNFSNAVFPLRNSLSQLNLKPNEGLATVTGLVREAASQLSRQTGSVGVQLVRSVQQTDGLLLHSLNVAYLAMLVAYEAGWEPLQIEDAGLAGLVHDLGELKIPPQILNKRTPLSKSELNYLHMHVQYGYDQLTQLKAFNPAVRRAVRQHHERLDGSGYPDGLKGEQLDELGRLIAVVDSYEEQVNPKHAPHPHSPNQVMASLFKKAEQCFDANYVKLLVRILGVYPPGSLVRLDDGTLALVISSLPEAPLKPCVLPYERKRPAEGVHLIELNHSERTIAGCCNRDELTPSQQEYFNLGGHFCYYFNCFPSPP